MSVNLWSWWAVNLWWAVRTLLRHSCANRNPVTMVLTNPK